MLYPQRTDINDRNQTEIEERTLVVIAEIGRIVGQELDMSVGMGAIVGAALIVAAIIYWYYSRTHKL